MTEITFQNTAPRYTLVTVGHANYSSYGHDIVCAAISMLTFTLINALDQIPSSSISKSYTVNSGYSKCQVTLKEDIEPNMVIQIETIFQTIVGGLEMLSKQYPEHVRYTNN